MENSLESLNIGLIFYQFAEPSMGLVFLNIVKIYFPSFRLSKTLGGFLAIFSKTC